MADSERYTMEDTMEGESETVKKIRELQSDENVVVRKMENGDMNVNQISNEAGITPHMEKYLSKKQIRKLRKEQQKLSRRKDKRAKERMRKKMKRAAQRETGYVKPKRTHISRMEDSKCKQRVAIDMQFECLMKPKDIRHLFVQLAHAYAVNRRAENPLQFSVVGFSGSQNKVSFSSFLDIKNIELKLISFVNIMRNFYNYFIFANLKRILYSQLFFDNPNNHHWDVVFTEQPLDAVFEKNEIVYLTADSENSLQTLDNSKVYIIGGLLDHNSRKGHCLKLAKEKGYAHARLPIAEYVMLQTRKVLTVNQVFEILLRYTENQSWKKSFLDVIPRRKGIVDNSVENNGNIERQKNDTTENVDDIHQKILD